MLRRQLDDVVERGVAFEHEESAVGITCVAAPVLGTGDDLALAGISVTGPVGRFQPARHASAVHAAAAGIAATLARRAALTCERSKSSLSSGHRNRSVGLTGQPSHDGLT